MEKVTTVKHHINESWSVRIISDQVDFRARKNAKTGETLYLNKEISLSRSYNNSKFNQ